MIEPDSFKNQFDVTKVTDIASCGTTNRQSETFFKGDKGDDAALDFAADFFRVAHQPLAAGDVEERLVDADWLDERRV